MKTELLLNKECVLDDSLSFHSQCHIKHRCAKYETCPMIIFQKIISGKWKILILWYLSSGPLRFSDLKRKLPNTTQKMLTNQLRSLEEYKLIYRKIYAEFPPHVEYGLTDIGKKIVPLLEAMYKYGIEYSYHN